MDTDNMWYTDFGMISIVTQNNIPTLNILRSYSPYDYIFYINTSTINLAYNSLNQDLYTVKKYIHVRNGNTLFMHVAVRGKEYLLGLQLDYLIKVRNFMIWDWIYPLTDINLTHFKADQ